MRYQWISWYHVEETMGSFELHHPWWVSGETMSEPVAVTICAAIPNVSESEAEAIVRKSYDKPPGEIKWRFNTSKEGEPFGDRFARAKWMKWPKFSEKRKQDSEKGHGA